MRKMMFCPMMYKMNWGMYSQMCPKMYPGMYQGIEQEIEPNMENIYAEDDKDEEYFMDMYPESCKKIMPYVNRELDKMETEESSLYEEYPDREMMERLGDRVYDKAVADMPDMEEQWEGRQFGRRRFLRDLTGLLLLGNILGRRRRRRRRFFHHDHDYDNFNYY